MKKFAGAGALASVLALAACGGNDNYDSREAGFRAQYAEEYAGHRNYAAEVVGDRLTEASAFTSISKEQIAAIVDKVRQIDIAPIVEKHTAESMANYYSATRDPGMPAGWSLVDEFEEYAPFKGIEAALEKDWRFEDCNVLKNVGVTELPINRGECRDGKLATATISYEAGSITYYGNEERICIAGEVECDRFNDLDRQRFKALAEAFYAERDKREALAAPILKEEVAQLRANLGL